MQDGGKVNEIFISSAKNRSQGTGYQEINDMHSFFSRFCGKIFSRESFLLFYESR
jgi:hypothetical protein